MAEEATKAMPESTWWGLKFLDVKYLANWRFSPSIEVFRYNGDQFRVKISGSHELDPGLNSEQLSCVKFLGWEQTEIPNCDCLFSPLSDLPDTLTWFEESIQIIQIIYGVSSQCAILGSNDFVNFQLDNLEGSRWSRKLGGYRFSTESYNRIDLR